MIAFELQNGFVMVWFDEEANRDYAETWKIKREIPENEIHQFCNSINPEYNETKFDSLREPYFDEEKQEYIEPIGLNITPQYISRTFPHFKDIFNQRDPSPRSNC